MGPTFLIPGSARSQTILARPCLSPSPQPTNLQKRVEVSIFLSSPQSQRSFLVVSDNGCGMDKDRIRAFATYFLGQEDRGLAPMDTEGQERRSPAGLVFMGNP